MRFKSSHPIRTRPLGGLPSPSWLASARTTVSGGGAGAAVPVQDHHRSVVASCEIRLVVGILPGGLKPGRAPGWRMLRRPALNLAGERPEGHLRSARVIDFFFPNPLARLWSDVAAPEDTNK